MSAKGSSSPKTFHSCVKTKFLCQKIGQWHQHEKLFCHRVSSTAQMFRSLRWQSTLGMFLMYKSLFCFPFLLTLIVYCIHKNVSLNAIVYHTEPFSFVFTFFLFCFWLNSWMRVSVSKVQIKFSLFTINLNFSFIEANCTRPGTCVQKSKCISLLLAQYLHMACWSTQMFWFSVKLQSSQTLVDCLNQHIKNDLFSYQNLSDVHLYCEWQTNC